MKLVTAPSKSQQIADIIKSQIVSGVIKSGSRLDNVRNMAEKFSVSTRVIMCSYDILEKEKLIVRKRKKGAFIRDSNLRKDINIIMPKDMIRSDRFRRECFSAIMGGIADVLSKSDYKAGIGRVDVRNYDYESYGGVIIFGAEDYKKLVRELDRRQIPWITVNNTEEKGVSQVLVDRVGGARAAIEYLIGLGHRKIGFLSTSESSQEDKYRTYWEGYKQAFEANGLEVDASLKVECSESMEGGCKGAEKLLSANKSVTAIFAGFDIKAVGVISAAGVMGYKVPEDLSVLGFYDISDAEKLSPPLTSVRFPEYEIGCELARNIMDLIEGKKKTPVKVILEPKLIVRRSTAINRRI